VYVCVGLFNTAARRCTLWQCTHGETATGLQVSRQSLCSGNHLLPLYISLPQQHCHWCWFADDDKRWE